MDALLELLDADDPVVRAGASAAIRRQGTAAIPALERALGHPSAEVRGRADELLQRLPEHALRDILRLPEYGEVRRLWGAVVDAVIWKLPLSVDVGRELLREERGLEALRELEAPRHHSAGEILAGLRQASWRILRDQLAKVGLRDAQVEISRGKQRISPLNLDFLAFVRRAEPDATSFEEVYGTLQSQNEEGSFVDMRDWTGADWTLATRLLVQMRRRPGEPTLGPLATDEEILALACRGPIVRGIADALGRVFANRGLSKFEQATRQRKEAGENAEDEVRRVYRLLFELDRWIGRTYYDSSHLSSTRLAVPATLAEIPAARCGLFDLVNADGDPARRVTADLLSRLEDPPWSPGDDETVARLLRAVASLTAAAAAP